MRDFLALKFWPKGIFWGCEKQVIFLGVVFFISSIKYNSTITYKHHLLFIWYINFVIKFADVKTLIDVFGYAIRV